jgi:ribosomal protein S18 acetylase RimI-like enzyme
MKEALFDQVINRTREIQQAHPKNKCQLTFQYHPTEIASIKFVQSHGCAHTESVFRLLRDLSKELKDAPQPPNNIEVRPWKIESEADLQAYVRARNDAFPEAPITTADWQAFLNSDSNKEGTTITAFDGQEICGCVTAYWDEAISQRVGQKIGFTEYIFVREKWRKQGIAAFMITQAMKYLKQHGREAAFLEVKAANEKALSLYYRLGYVKVDETRLYVLDV